MGGLLRLVVPFAETEGEGEGSMALLPADTVLDFSLTLPPPLQPGPYTQTLRQFTLFAWAEDNVGGVAVNVTTLWIPASVALTEEQLYRHLSNSNLGDVTMSVGMASGSLYLLPPSSLLDPLSPLRYSAQAPDPHPVVLHTRPQSRPPGPCASTRCWCTPSSCCRRTSSGAGCSATSSCSSSPRSQPNPTEPKSRGGWVLGMQPPEELNPPAEARHLLRRRSGQNRGSEAVMRQMRQTP